MTLGKRIRDRRLELGLSQVELAHTVGMTPSALCYLELGRNRDTFKLVELAETLGVDAHWLKSGTKMTMRPSTAHDIRARNANEDALRAAKAAAERADQAKSRFLATASNDLRKQLSALAIYASLLKGRLPPQDRPLFVNLQNCVESLTTLLNDLLDLSKLQAGVVKVRVDDLDLRRKAGQAGCDPRRRGEA